MTRICILGSSHVGAAKLGADLLLKEKAIEGLDIRIFGSHKNSLASCVVKKGKVTSSRNGILNNFEWTSGGHREVILPEYAAVYVVAGQSIFDIQPYLAVNAPRGPHDLPPISDALFKSINGSIVGNFAFDLARKIAEKNTETMTYHVGAPLLSDDSPIAQAIVTGLKEGNAGLISRVKRLKALLKDRAEELATDNFKIIHPPTQALEKNRLFTRGEYCRDSIRLEETWDVKHGERDYVHMNAKYGQQLIENLLKLNHPEVLETKTAAAE